MEIGIACVLNISLSCACTTDKSRKTPGTWLPSLWRNREKWLQLGYKVCVFRHVPSRKYGHRKNNTRNGSVTYKNNRVVGFHFHERCLILIEEAEVVGGGEGLHCPHPPRVSTPPLPLHKTVGGRKRGAAPFLSLLASTLPNPHKRNRGRPLPVPVALRQ